MLATKLDDLNLIQEAHRMEGENRILEIVYASLGALLFTCVSEGVGKAFPGMPAGMSE